MFLSDGTFSTLPGQNKQHGCDNTKRMIMDFCIVAEQATSTACINEAMPPSEKVQAECRSCVTHVRHKRNLLHGEKPSQCAGHLFPKERVVEPGSIVEVPRYRISTCSRIAQVAVVNGEHILLAEQLYREHEREANVFLFLAHLGEVLISSRARNADSR
jgi:hypothetical protein